MRCLFKSLRENFRRRDMMAWMVIAFVFFIGNHFTLLSADDIYYKFVCGTVEQGVAERLTCVADLWRSFWGHFLVMNGRSFLNVFLLQSALNLMPIWVFDILNTLVWLALTYMVASQVELMNNNKRGAVVVMTATILFVLFPVPFETLFWKSGAVNYLWSALALMMTLSAVVKDDTSLLGTTLLCVGLGLMHEGVCVPFIAFAILDALIRRSPKRLWFAAGVLLGFSLQLLNVTGDRDVQSAFSLFTDLGLWRLLDVLDSLTSSLAFVILVCCMAFWLFRDWTSGWAYVRKRYQYFILLVLYMGMLVLIGHISGPRKFMPVHVISVLLLVDMLLANVELRTSNRFWLGTFLAFSAWFFVSTLWPNYKKVNEEIDIMHSSNDKVVMAVTCPVKIFDAEKINGFYANYSLFYRRPFQKLYDVKKENHVIVKYALPEPIYKGVYVSDNLCGPENEIQPGVFVFRDVHMEYSAKQYVVIRCEDGEAMSKKNIEVSFVHDNYPIIGDLMDILRKPKTVVIDKHKVAPIVSAYGTQYVIVDVGWPKFYKVDGVSIM